MKPPVGLKERLGSPRTWVALTIVAPLCLLAVTGLMLLEMRRDAWESAELKAQGLLQLIGHDIARNAEIIDLALRSVAENLRTPGVSSASPELRQLILFDRSATARDIGVMLVLDETGESVFDAAGYPPRKLNNADRDYFKAHKADPALGLHISRPVVSRLTGAPVVVFSRRIDKPDGSFGGIVLASLKLSYFQNLFERAGLGGEGAINLYLSDGTRIMRLPHVAADIGASIAGSRNFERFVNERSGAFIAESVRDGAERLYTFTQIGELPLILNVAFESAAVEAEWRRRALALGVVLLVLCGLAASLSLLFGRELRRRAEMQSELTRLSRTDALTGLPNRRHFETEFARAVAGSDRTLRPMSLLIVDADHFKRINDRHGHAVGDAVLTGLAARLSNCLRRPEDIVARIGGEEFAMILCDASQASARRLADRIHAEVARLAVPAAGIGEGDVTVSIGLAATLPGRDPLTREELYRLADAALYEAKAGGRNQTRCARQDADQIPAIGVVRAAIQN